MESDTSFQDELDVSQSASSTEKEAESLWTVNDVANYLRLEPETIRSMARRGELPSLKVGRRLWRFKAGEIKNWLNSHPDK